MKRGRNQRRRQGPNPNRALDSNGPDVRIRGTANQIYDKYLTLARDATSSGDRVKAENYFQHAEHYFRVIRAQQPAPAPQAAQTDQPGDDAGSRQSPSGGGEGKRPEHEEAREDGEDQAQQAARAANGADPAPVDEAKDEEPKPAAKKPRQRRARRPAKTDDAATSEGEEKAADETAAS